MAKVLQMSDGDGNVYPVGAVFGSNSDGSYTKFADGTLICWKVLSFTGLAINTAWGGVYENHWNPLLVRHLFGARNLTLLQLSV